MYLKQLYIENSGPVRQLQLELPFTEQGAPKPLVVVGGNGSGKTNVLSIVADALFEAAARYYHNVTPGGTPAAHQFFRVVGASTVSLGAKGSAIILEFEHEGGTIFFTEKSGSVSPAELASRLPPTLQTAAKWKGDDVVKRFDISSDLAGKIFRTGVYAYFPSNRNEPPFWLNQDSVIIDEFSIAPFVRHELYKPIYLERYMSKLSQWILSVIVEARVDLHTAMRLSKAEPSPQIGRSMLVQQVLDQLNQILRRVLDDDQVRLVWTGRHKDVKIGIAKGDQLDNPGLYSLSLQGNLRYLGYSVH